MKNAYPVILAAALALANPAVAQLPAAVDDQPLPSLAPMLERVTPSVVNIATRGHVRVRENPLLQDPFFRRFFDIPQQPRERQTQSLGSGVVVDADAGYVLTNSHVVANADEITVTLESGLELPAKVVGSDPETDIAVLQVEAERGALRALPIADSDDLRVGDFVVAIGNPFGLSQTVTSGIVSALGRSGLGIHGYESFIQTDASINPGNSGGALVNLRGELVGVNSAILAPSGGNIGIGFAIPANMARQVMAQLVEHGEVRRGLLGVSVQDLTPALAEALGIPRRSGAVVTDIAPDSAAAQAGLKVGDVIVGLNGEPVTNAAAVRNRVGLIRVGEEVRLTVARDGKERSVTATIRARDDQPARAGDLSPRLQGAEFAPVPDPDQQDRTRVGVARVEPGSPAFNAGLRQGDLVLSVNRQPVENLSQFRQLLRDSRSRLLLHIRRGSGAFFMLLQ